MFKKFTFRILMYNISNLQILVFFSPFRQRFKLLINSIGLCNDCFGVFLRMSFARFVFIVSLIIGSILRVQ